MILLTKKESSASILMNNVFLKLTPHAIQIMQNKGFSIQNKEIEEIIALLISAIYLDE